MAKESNIKSFVLRIDAETLEALEGWAADEFRSVNGQLQWIIADALRRSGRVKKVKSKPQPQPDYGAPVKCTHPFMPRTTLNPRAIELANKNANFTEEEIPEKDKR